MKVTKNDLVKNKHIIFTIPGAIAAGVFLIQAFLWVEDRYQHVTESICMTEKHTLQLELLGNEIKLEFYSQGID